MIKKITFIILLIFVFLLIPVIYSYYWAEFPVFWSNVMIGIFSTAIALIGGIPTALWIDRVAKKREEKTKFREDRIKEKEILELIDEELGFDQQLLESRSIESYQPLKNELWEVLKNSGKLKLVLDPKLLNRITSAYYVIDTIFSFEDKAISEWNLQNRVLDASSTWSILFKRARGFDQLLKDSIKEAKRMMDERMKELVENNKDDLNK